MKEKNIVKEFSIELAVRLNDPLNRVDFTDITKLAKRIDKIISVIKFGVVRDETPIMLNNGQGVKESDTTMLNSSTEAKSQNILKSNKLGNSSTEADKPLQNSPVKEDWISVEDRLPIIGQTVLTFPHYKVLPFGNTEDDKEGAAVDTTFWEWKGDNETGGAVVAKPFPTHWQPLPAPPKPTLSK